MVQSLSIRGRSLRRTPSPAALALALVTVVASGAPAGRTAESGAPAALFARNCSGCHSYGKGTKIGPDLKGVTVRRPRNWLHKFIRSSRGVIQSQDPVAVELFQQFKRQQMPDWDLSDTQIDSLLDYFASGGPERKAADQRHGATATDAEVARGRKLFSGEASLQHVAFACSSCHPLAGDSNLAGGSLGPDLTDSYARYQDQAFTSRLKEPCPPVAAAMTAGTYLTPDEVFALKAYLRKAAVAIRSLVAGK